jgi:hypothetical protein
MRPYRFSPISYYISIILLFFCQSNLNAQIKLEQQHLVLKKGVMFDLKLPKGYKIAVAAQGMRRLRFLAKSPDGRLFGTDMYNLRSTFLKIGIKKLKNLKKLLSLPRGCVIQTK